MADSKKGVTIADAVNQIGQNRVAINFVWTLITGFLVMFMQAGSPSWKPACAAPRTPTTP